MRQWQWNELKDVMRQLQWNSLGKQQLHVGMCGQSARCHYNVHDTLYVQVSGCKQVIVIEGEAGISDYPLNHPLHTFAMLNSIEFDKGHGKVNAHSIVLLPGDTLYIPKYCWHECVDLSEKVLNISLSFEFETMNKTESTLLVARNLEKLCVQYFGGLHLKDILLAATQNEHKTDNKGEHKSERNTKILKVQKDVIHHWLELLPASYNIPSFVAGWEDKKSA
ncbi:hypothetical protein RFI_15585 [Reticulomyxa filosa]|uniref:JmjC domain-containing protein n=1 Tax=Reticulomyxa filosa TaxID=46433 RepID=X6N8I2_RETFI|nr:hypothetical protein RFI_15585 [Reticulomyxa filosa]|eukprot:ETO21617.1 hypothetical protein RFI_15585 [Reticulomyxa filosa]